MKIILLVTLVLGFGLFFCVWPKVKKNEIKENSSNDRFKEDIYIKRMNWLLGYLLIAILLFGLWLGFKNQMKNEIIKIIFCGASNFLGAFIYGYKWRIRSKANPFPTYLVYYPLIIVVFSSFSFALTTIILSVTKISNELVFYTLAFFISIYCGQHIDNVKELGSIIKNFLTTQ